MDIKIAKKNYNNLNDEDKLLAWYLQQNKGFEDTILDSRKKIGIPPEGWDSPVHNFYGQGPELLMRVLCTVDKSGDLKPHGNWVKKRKVIKQLQPRIDSQVNEVMSQYRFPGRWASALGMLICYGELWFNPPPKIEARQTSDGAVAIVIHGKIDSTNKIKKWIDENWDLLQAMSVRSIDKKAKISSIPKHEKWEYYKDILRLRDEEKRTFSDIAEQLSNKDVPVKIWDDETINEQSVKVAYHRIKKILHNLQRPPKSSVKR